MDCVEGYLGEYTEEKSAAIREAGMVVFSI